MSHSVPDECAENCRRHDPDRWLTALFAPDARRPALLALYAFNLEIARTAEQVSEPMLGAIRLQWWRETVEGIRAGKARRHPVAEALQAAGAAQWSEADFNSLIDARERDLDPEPMADMAALLRYAEASSAPLLRLAAAAIGAPLDQETSRYAGQAYALIGLLRAVPFHAAQERVLIPATLLREQGLEPEALYRQELGPQAFAAFRQVGLEAQRLLTMVRRRPVARAQLPVLLPLTLAARHLRRLQAAGYDPRLLPSSDGEAAGADVGRYFALLWAALRCRI
ncbi:phytoene/squalene synthase family protein [Ferrovibrio sp.]|uniref:phytoene/squalene synthase family protein n=1 Tax=Ferrovibrio sp. TaxID=1917215 RepID=UPI0035B3AE33